MNREILKFTSEADWLAARKNDITSTESAVLLGVSPYTTLYQLFYNKLKGSSNDKFNNEAMEAGKRLESTIAQWFADEQGWTIRRMDEYIRLPDLRLGSSFDYSVDDDTLLEIKNVGERAYREKWTDESAAPHIEAQVQHQLLVSGRSVCYIGALVGGNRKKLIRRERNEQLIASILSRASDFWAKVDAQEPPPPDVEKDYSAILESLSYAEPNRVVAASPELEQLCAEYDSYSQRSKDIDTIRDKLKARILLILGDAEQAKGQKYTVSAKMVGPAEVSYVRKGYRSFSVKARKEKP